MFNNKVYCMKIAKKYDKNYWDGNRKYGYGGYKYIPEGGPTQQKILFEHIN